MADIVTLSEAKDFCRVLHDDEDMTIALMIAAATDAVADIADAWDGLGEAPPRLKLAVLTRVAIMYDQRDSMEAGKGELSLLTPLRVLGV